MTDGDEAPLSLPPRPPPPAGAPLLPEGTCDCHFHVIAAGVPFVSPRDYTPAAAPLKTWQALAHRLDIARGVVVQPSVYGRDNGALFTALAAGAGMLRGIVVIDPDTPDGELDRLHECGVRGVRVNLRNPGGLTLASVPHLATRIAPLGWHLQFQVGPQQFADLSVLLRTLPVPAVIDHAGFIPVGNPAGARHPTAALKRLLDGGRTYVKLSAPYRFTRMPDYPGFAELVTSLVASHPERLLWGSDWPHTDLFQSVPDDLDLAKKMLEWLAADEVRRLVFVETPRRLYWPEA